MQRGKRTLSALKKHGRVVVHHAGSTDHNSNHETLAAHLKATNLGYHYTVDDDAVFKSKAAGSDGRWTFKQQAPLTDIVWGATGCNEHGIHVSIDGNSITTGVTDDEKTCLAQIIVAIFQQMGWTKKDLWRIVTHQYVGLHISYTKYFTECPGPPIINWMPECIRRVGTYLPD